MVAVCLKLYCRQWAEMRRELELPKRMHRLHKLLMRVSKWFVIRGTDLTAQVWSHCRNLTRTICFWETGWIHEPSFGSALRPRKGHAATTERMENPLSGANVSDENQLLG